MKTFSAFFEENYSLVVGVAERRLNSRPDAEEIATEAFRIAWEKYLDGCPLTMPWIYGIVRNLIGDEYRKRGRRADLQQRLNSSFALRESTTHESRMDIHDAINRLPSAERDVLEMTYWERLTSEEIAEILDVTSATVRQRIARARKHLLAALTESDDTNERRDNHGETARVHG
ncbi:MAG: sigma-70 family RNA polymerase sigma factor [Ancrocorticia sp.]